MNFWNWLFHPAQREKELDEEIQAHLRMAAEERVAQGESAEQAQTSAAREFGNDVLVKEVTRDMWGWSWAEELIQDLHYGFRRLHQSPGFAVVCVLTLALGIGANTAIFTLVNAVMLKSLPVPDPEQLYRLGDNNNCCVMTGSQDGGSFVLYSYQLYEELRAHTPEFSQLAAFQPFMSGLLVRRSGASSAAEPYSGEFVSGNYFAMMGIVAAAGRSLTPADDAPDAAPVAVMNYHTWQERFGLDPSVIGTSLDLNGVAYTVAGVTPPGFYGDTLRSDPPDFWLPLGTEPALNRTESRLHRPELQWLYLIGRLKPGVRVATAQSHLTVVLQQWLWAKGSVEATPEQRNDPTLVEQARQEIARQHIRLTPARNGVNQMQTDYGAALRLLVTVAALVLLIACANLANLLLSRGTASQLQTAIRMALGAPRRRLIRQMLTESVLLAALGGAAGLLLAYSGTRAILLLAFRGANYVPISPAPSSAVLCFTVLLSLVTAIVFGTAPAWIASRCDPADALRGAGRSTPERSSLPRRSLVVLQVALSTVLLVGAGLLTQSLRNLEDQNFGFVTDGRLVVHVDPDNAGIKPERLPGLYQQIELRLQQIPGVLSASLSDYSPMEGENWNVPVYVLGHTADNSVGGRNASFDRVSAHYFETIGTRLLKGRAIGDQDTPASPHVAVINETIARKFFPGEDPIGQHFGIGSERHSGDYEIVGIVEDAKYQDARKPAYPTAFLPLRQTPPQAARPDSSIYIHDIELHVAGKPQNLELAIRKTINGIDPNLSVLGMISFGEQVALNFNQERLVARLTELFGLLALILACVGLYGVTAYSVACRTREFGVRIALGADRASILGMVLRSALLQIGLGLALGVPTALAGGRLLSSQLYGVGSHDSLVLGLAAAILAACGLAAAFAPARRATKVDPMVALRHE
jgi:predicted permease